MLDGVLSLGMSHEESVLTTVDAMPGVTATAKGIDVFESMFGADMNELDMDYISDAPLVTVCFDLMMYESADLFEAAFRTLARHFRQREALMSTLSEVQLLVTPETEQAYMLLDRKLDFIRNHFESYETWGEDWVSMWMRRPWASN